MAFENPFLDDDSLDEEYATPEDDLDQELGLSSPPTSDLDGGLGGLPDLGDLSSLAPHPSHDDHPEYSGGDYSDGDDTGEYVDEDATSDLRYANEYEGGGYDTTKFASEDSVDGGYSEGWDRGYQDHDETGVDGYDVDDEDTLDGLDLDALIDQKKSEIEQKGSSSGPAGWGGLDGDGDWGFDEEMPEDDEPYHDPRLDEDDEEDEDWDENLEGDDDTDEEYVPPVGDLFGGATTSTHSNQGGDSDDNSSAPNAGGGDGGSKTDGLKSIIERVKAKVTEVVSSVRSELAGGDTGGTREGEPKPNTEDSTGGGSDGEGQGGGDATEVPPSKSPMGAALSKGNGLYGKFTGVFERMIATLLGWVGKIPGMEKHVLRIVMTTRIVQVTARVIPVLIVLGVLATFSYLSVAREATSELPDSGSVAMSQFSYSNGGTALGVVKNTSETTVEPVINFTVYSIQPTLNPKTWFMYQKDLTCQSDPVTLDIGEQKEASAPCGQAKGWFPRVSSTAE
jgi:hypothetical protein